MKTNTIRIAKELLLSLVFILAGSFVFSQGSKYRDMEDLMDKNMEDYIQIYRITDNYPDFSYKCTYSDGSIEKVIVENVENEIDQKRLEVLIYDIKRNKELIKNTPTRSGIYYSVDQQAEPEDGFEDFRLELLKNLKYPQEAKNWGVEGTVYARFVVDSNGEISNIYVTEDIESSMDSYVNDLKESTKEAVMETSGSWKPAEVNGINVSSLVVLPITFKIERNPTIPMMI